MRRTLRNGTVVEILPLGSRIRLPGNTIIEGRPHDTDEYRATAQRLGYGDDTLLMAQHHDPLHCWLTDALGLPVSYSLLAAAGLFDADDHNIPDAEEHAVMAIQRFMRLAGIGLPL